MNVVPDLLEESSLRYLFVPYFSFPADLCCCELTFVFVPFPRQSLLQMLLLFAGVAVMALLSAIVD